MKKFMGWLMVLAVGVFVVGCSEGDKPKEKPKADAAKPAEKPKEDGK